MRDKQIYQKWERERRVETYYTQCIVDSDPLFGLETRILYVHAVWCTRPKHNMYIYFALFWWFHARCATGLVAPTGGGGNRWNNIFVIYVKCVCRQCARTRRPPPSSPLSENNHARCAAMYLFVTQPCQPILNWPLFAKARARGWMKTN